MKTVVVKTSVELLDKLQLPSGFHMYRGQGNNTRPLLPTIARVPSDCLEGYENWNVLLDTLLSDFQRLSLPYLESKPVNRMEWLIIAQHHGIPTNILDWTTNPLKALFFAVENPADDAVDGAVWDLEPTGYYNDLTKILEIKGGQLDSLVSYIPPHIHARVAAQESCFTFFPLPDSNPIPALENIDYYKKDVAVLVKFVIPKEHKMMCRHELRALGISHMSMFPGLDGVAKTIKRELDLPW